MADLLDNEPQYRCADARDRALKTIQEVKAAERDAIPPIVTAGSLYCPHCPVSSLKEEQYGENVYIKVCDPYGDDHQGCGYKWVTDARGNSDIFRQQNAMRVANERASLQRTVDQFAIGTPTAADWCAMLGSSSYATTSRRPRRTTAT
jgi:hypothetical protein